jgi:Collagen triple helix repeat (20 copies)
MFSSLRKRFGVPGLIGVLVLVCTMAGVANAANNGLTAKQKKQVTAIAKKYAGKPGANGAAGAQGAQGPKGDTGSAGTNGTNGTNGTPGSTGATGQRGATGTTGADGAAGGDGVTGPTGPEGSPWTELGTLPPEETLTGVWGFGKVTTGGAPAGPGQVPNYLLPIDFALPLEAPLPAAQTHILETGASPTTDCPGSAADPQAAIGHLCVYAGNQSGPGTFLFQGLTKPSTGIAGAGLEGADVSGALLNIGAIAAEAFGSGTWAVTAPAAP